MGGQRKDGERVEDGKKQKRTIELISALRPGCNQTRTNTLIYSTCLYTCNAEASALILLSHRVLINQFQRSDTTEEKQRRLEMPHKRSCFISRAGERRPGIGFA